MKPVISMLLPTRGRHEGLQKSLGSLLIADDVANFEVLIRCDDDDLETLPIIEQSKWPFTIKTIVKPRGNGYADLHLMYNELCSISSGNLLFLWNSDSTMLTKGWDMNMLPYDDGKLRYLDTTVTPVGHDYTFPIIHRSYYEALGHYSPWAHNDTYVLWVMKPFFDAGAYAKVNVMLQHDSEELVAQGEVTTLEGRAKWPQTRPIRRTPEFQSWLRDDQHKISQLISRQASKV